MVSYKEMQELVQRRATVKVKDDAFQFAGRHVRAMGVNFYASYINVKIGFLDEDGSYSGEARKVPLEWIELI